MWIKSSFTTPAVVAISLGLIGGTSPAAADILHVPDDFLCIQEAIDAAVDGDEVVVADGTYTGACNKNLDFQNKAITLRSESGNRVACIIDCETSGRFAIFGAGDTAVVQSLTIQNGNVANGGAALLNAGSSPSFDDCIFQDCNAFSNGGAFRVLNASVTINGCVFQGNTAGSQGGGAINGSGASVAVTDTEFDGNHAEGNGGGMNILGGEATVSGCSFTGNTADQGGGGFASTQNFLEISNCIFQGNEAGFGAGVLFRNFSTTRVENVVFLNNTAVGNGSYGGGVAVEQGSSPEFVNCLFAGNHATGGSGGAIDVFGDGATPTMVNCTFSGNSTEAYGGAVFVAENAHLQLVNCVLWGNDAPDGPEIQIGFPGCCEGGQVTVSYSDVAGGEAGVSIDGGTLNWGDGNIDRDPLFVDPDGPDDDPDTYEDNDYRLGAGSSAIDAADNTSVPKGIDTDLDDNPRFIDDPTTKDTGLGDCPIVDMGSYEFQEGTTDCCAWDLDGSGSVGAADLLDLLFNWGPCPGCAADFDGDDIVGASDLLAMLFNWGPCL